MQIIKPEDCTQGFVDPNDRRSYYRDLIKQYGHSEDCGNQTPSVSSTAAVDRNPNKTIFDTRIEAIENAEEEIDVLSRHSDTQGRRKKPVSPTRDQIDEIELENLRAK